MSEGQDRGLSWLAGAQSQAGGAANGGAGGAANGGAGGATSASSGGAPKAPTLTSAVDRIDRSTAVTKNIREKLLEIACRLDPSPLQGGENKANAPTPSGLVSIAHSKHSDLEDVLDDVTQLVLRIDRAIG